VQKFKRQGCHRTIRWSYIFLWKREC